MILILAGVTVATLTGDNGLLQKASDAKTATQKASEKERIQVEVAGAYDKKGNLLLNELKENIKNISNAIVSGDDFPLIVTYDSGNKYKIDENGIIKEPLPKINSGEKAPNDSNAEYTFENYTAVIPAGFTVSNVDGEKSIKTGLVIRDDTGNEFVWIPIGIPWKSDSNKTIELSRYTFDDYGNPTNQGNNEIDIPNTTDYYAESSSSSYGNAVAKTDINSTNGFISKTMEAGGFWIGRYEARVIDYTGSVITSNSENKINWTGYTNGKLVEKPGEQVFNYITQNKAAEISRGMYNSKYFESDLINSYAWDTATLFLQEYDNRTRTPKTVYSMQVSIYLGNSPKTNGTVSETDYNQDKICNVYDMASNCFEWTTETSSIDGKPGVHRGGYYGSNYPFTSIRGTNETTVANATRSFRPILYVK